MSYTVMSGSHPDFYILTYFNNIEYEELFLADELHLNEGRCIYILADTSRMNNTLPDHFIEGINKSFLKHPNIAHIASYIPSSILGVAGRMVVKLTRQQERITIFQNYDEAYQHIVNLIQESQSSSQQKVEG